MSLDWVVYWLAVVSCVALLANLAASRFAQGFAWSVKCVLVHAIAGIAYRQQSAALQALTGGLWALLIAVPPALGRLSGASALRFRYDPEVSGSAHAAGLVIGLVAATLAMLGHRPAHEA
jgi:hypothetical protein